MKGILDALAMKALPTEEVKAQRWERFVKKRIETMHVLSRADVPRELLDLMKAGLDGGNCSICEKPWEPVVFDNLFGKGRYYRPACWCHYRCPRCHIYLWEEQLAGRMEDGRCPYCWWRLVVEEGGKMIQRWGKEYEITLSQMARRPVT